MFAALNSNGSLNVPTIGNTFRLDLASLFPLYDGVVPGSGVVADIQRIDDLTLDPLGVYLAWTQGRGTAAADPENLFIQVWIAGTPIQISKSPPTGIQQGIRRGSIYFTPPPTPGICWVQGTDSRSAPTANAVALWSMLLPDKAPLRLSGIPVTTAKHIIPLNCGQ